MAAGTSEGVERESIAPARPAVAVPFRDALLPAVAAWVTARIVVLLALAFAHYVVDHIGRPKGASLHAVHDGLLAWDGAWYSDIASRGYGALPREALRFFPGFPLAGRLLGSIGIGDRAGLLVVANVAALLAGTALYQLARWEGRDHATAVRAVWLLALAPPAFVFVMGYSDAPAVALAIFTMYALRRRKWAQASVFAVLAGLCRPTAFLLLIPAAIETWRAGRTTSARDLLLRVGAVIAAPLGTITYLLWVRGKFGDLMLPFRIQTQSHLRGRMTDPATAIVDAARGAFHGHLGTALHVPWIALLVALLVVVWRRWPLSYAAFSAAVLLSSVTSHNLDSLERYALLAFPLVLAASDITASRLVERIVFVLMPVAMFGYATLAFLGLIGP